MSLCEVVDGRHCVRDSFANNENHCRRVYALHSPPSMPRRPPQSPNLFRTRHAWSRISNNYQDARWHRRQMLICHWITINVHTIRSCHVTRCRPILKGLCYPTCYTDPTAYSISWLYQGSSRSTNCASSSILAVNKVKGQGKIWPFLSDLYNKLSYIIWPVAFK